jgi:hypothetical protein
MARKNEQKKIGFDYRSSRFFALLFPTLYIVALVIFCLIYQVLPGPEFLILGFLIYAVYNKKTWGFLKDWLPFITIFVSYQLLYGLVGTIAQYNLHTGPEVLEMQLFGQIPALTLQQTIQTPILDYMGAFFYTAYFFVPTLFAYILWKSSPKNYWKYTIAFGVCTYSALVTYLFYPVAPPWIAVPGVTQILTSSVDGGIGLPVYKWIFSYLNPDLYAAFPSMHSALPWLVFLFAFKAWKKKALPVLVLPVGTWFSAVYLGEHFFIDVLGGIAYATVAFIAVEKILPLIASRNGFLGKHVPTEKTEKNVDAA